MLIELNSPWIVTLNVASCAIIQVGLAWAFVKMPTSWFKAADRPRHGPSARFYEQVFGIKRWKDLLPDGARWFSGGFAKATLRRRDAGYLERFRVETHRGESCHWTALALTPVFLIWNPLWAVAILAGWMLIGNIPCILVQRYNRGRLSALLADGVKKKPEIRRAARRIPG